MDLRRSLSKNKDKKELAIDSIERNKIEEMTRNLCETYGMCDFPIEPAKIAHVLEIPIQEAVFKRKDGVIISGGIVKENSSIQIYINRVDSMEGKRFTIAHELGHYFLSDLSEKDEYVDLHSEISANKTIEEKKADLFARSLLMPRDEVVNRYQVYKNIGFDEELIVRKIAEYFYVSRTVAKQRLVGLKLIRYK